GTVKVEAEEINSDNWKKASAFTENIGVGSGASGDKYLVASSGSAIGDQYYAEFTVYLAFDAQITLSAAYSQPEGKKAQNMDMARLYGYYIDGAEASITGENTVLSARDDVSVWDTFSYQTVMLAKGTHTVRIKLKENLGYAPNIDYITVEISAE
ncbi:MAG: hypothetical protein ACI3XR_01215, partial [Eubacteriales bacterium]